MNDNRSVLKKQNDLEKLSGVKCFLLDLDGTVYLSDEPIKGAVGAVERLRGRGRVIFLSNNTSRSTADYVTKLNNMGIAAKTDDFYTAGNATLDYLKAYHPTKKVFILGTDSLKKQFADGGIDIDESDPDLCVVGFDTGLSYEPLSRLCSHIRRGVPYLATHPDINCPVKGGYIPDVGSFIALIEKSTGVSPFIVCGKPNAPIADGIRRMTGLRPDEIAMVGDRVMTDMAFANANGFVSVFVLSGEGTLSELDGSGYRADIVLNSISEMV